MTQQELWSLHQDTLGQFVEDYNTRGYEDDSLNLGHAFLASELRNPCVFCLTDDDACYALLPGDSFWTITETNMVQLLSSDEAGQNMGEYSTLEKALDALVRISTDDVVQTYDEMMHGLSDSDSSRPAGP